MSSAGWGNGEMRGRIHDADNPPEAPKLSDSGSLLNKRLGREGPTFLCQNCETTPATTQLDCKHIICSMCLMNYKDRCPLCKTD